MALEKKRFFFRSLSSKISLFLSLTLFFMLLILNFFIIDHNISFLLDNAKEMNNELTEMFAKINSSPLARRDFYALEKNVIELQRDDNVLFARIYNKNGTLLTPSSRPHKEIENSLIYQREIFNDEMEIIGSVSVGYDLSHIFSEINSYKYILYILSFVIVLITCIILLYLINLVVHKPLKKLLLSVNNISKGDIDQKVEIDSDDEIGNLADNFNLMTSRLKSSINTINCIIESMPSALISIDKEYKVLQWNEMAYKITNIPRKTADNKYIFDLLPDFKDYEKEISNVLASNKHMSINRAKLSFNKDSFYEIHFFPLQNESVDGVVIRVDDITEDEKRDNQLIQAQKMESVGNLAGGLAHNFNNILAGIIGTTTFLEYKLETNQNIPADILKNKLAIIDEAGQRASELVKELMSISGRQKNIDLKAQDLCLLINNVIKICENTFDKSVEIKFNKKEEEAVFYGNSSKIEQVILNICINAYHSMTIMRKPIEKKGGILQISIDRFLADDYFSKTYANVRFDEYWLLSISDTGVGIDKKNLKKIFDPFFTTKNKEYGSGLGLAMVFGIINQHNGIIDVYSEAGEGTVFKIYLPVYYEENSEGKNEKSPSNRYCIKKGHGSILLIDDEENIRKIGSAMLKECGYTVYQAEDGIKGIEIFKEKKGEIRLIILDMIMPKKSGKEVLDEIKSISDDIKVIMISGYMDNEDSNKSKYNKADGFLLKPFTISALSDMISNILPH